MTAKVLPMSRPRVGGFERGDHVELAQRLVAELQAEGETIHDDGLTWQYNDARRVFEPLSLARASQIVQSFAGCRVKSDKKPLRLRAADVGGAIRLAQDSLCRPEFFANAPRGVAFLDCFLEVTAENIVKHPHSPEHRARFAYGFDYQERAEPEALLHFLSQVFSPDADASEKIAVLQEYVGASMLGVATRFQRAITQVGEGANGKSVLAAIVERAMPIGSVVAIPPQDFAHEYRAAMLAGKLLNLVSELPEADILDSESFKAVITGDTRTGRHIREAPFTFRPIAGHVYSANRLPGTTDQTHGFWRRFIVVGFNRIFVEREQDPKLAQRIVAAELPAIVSWFLAGAQRALQQNGYTVLPSSAAALEKWRRSADQVRAFVHDWTQPLPPDAASADGTNADTLYQDYRRWAHANGHKPMASNKFGERMTLLVLKSRHTSTGNVYAVLLRGGG